jgi:diguanylate cyclase (GGDEF)-like protein
LIGAAVATSPGPGDGALLYIWPVIWVAYFFGSTATVFIVAWIGVIHAIALIELPEASAYLDRWFDVIVPIGVVAAVVHALARRNEQLLSAAQTDARMDGLTALLNRRGFDERAPAQFSRAQRANTALAAVSFDIDYFKRINDAWGHDAGDRVLVRLGEIFQAQSRDTDIVARVGGEEFTALLWGSDREEAVAYAERIRDAFAKSDLGVGPITLSAGIACDQGPTLELDRMLHEADSALYAAKAAGRDRSVVHQNAQTSLLAR